MACASNRHRNLSGPTTTSSYNSQGGSSTRPLDNRTLATPPPGVPGASSSSRETVYSGYCSTGGILSGDNAYHQSKSGSISGVSGNISGGANTNSRDSSHNGSSNNQDTRSRKLDKSLSESDHDRLNGNHSSGRGVNSSRYKTELCRPFEESGHCKYGDKCQFAHGMHELRNLACHPKYKTKRCRTYHTIGFCPYGPRCHFIHNEDKRMLNKNYSSQQQQRALTASSTAGVSRPTNLSGLASLGSSFESVSPPSSSPGNLSPTFLTEDLLPSMSSSPPSSTHSQDSGSPRSSPIFNFPASDATGVTSLMTPLNIQTQQFYNNMVDMAALQFSAILNFSQNHRNNCNTSNVLNVTANIARVARGAQAVLDVDTGVCDMWMGDEAPDKGVSFPLAPSSPISLSGSLASSGSALDNPPASAALCDSPLELGAKSLRLPIFNKISADL